MNKRCGNCGLLRRRRNRRKYMKEKENERLTKLKQMEKELYHTGIKTICGIDEAGRGPLAGPVVVAAVIMPKDSMIEGVNDSKKVSEKKREILYESITRTKSKTRKNFSRCFNKH